MFIIGVLFEQIIFENIVKSFLIFWHFISSSTRWYPTTLPIRPSHSSDSTNGLQQISAILFLAIMPSLHSLERSTRAIEASVSFAKSFQVYGVRHRTRMSADSICHRQRTGSIRSFSDLIHPFPALQLALLLRWRTPPGCQRSVRNM